MSDGGVLAALLAVAGVLVLLAVVYYVCIAIAGWKIFAKAGEAGWKALIPLYNVYIMYKIGWKGMFFFVWFALAAVYSFLAGQGASNPSTMMTALTGLVSLLTFGVRLIQNLKLSKAFGHGTGFGLGLTFLTPIFLLILGFGSSQYQGPQA